MQKAADNLLALDVGERRVGVALANSVARLPRPYTTLDRAAGLVKTLQDIITEQGVGTLVIGLPRGLEGQETAQTKSVKRFAESLRDLPVRIEWQDEALTSVKAESELAKRKKPVNRSDVDALAATYILEDFLQGEGKPHYV